MSPSILDAAGRIGSSATACGLPGFTISKDTSYETNITFLLSQPIAIFLHLFLFRAKFYLPPMKIFRRSVNVFFKFCLCLYVLVLDAAEIRIFNG